MTDIRTDVKGATVGDLIDHLSKYPMSTLVIMAGDAEGNHHSPLAGIDEGWYDATSTWAGEVYYHLDPMDEDAFEKCLVLGPIN